MNDDKNTSTGFLGRGPLFWIGLTFGTTLAILGLILLEALDSKNAAMALMIVPIACMFATFVSLLNKNKAGTGECVTKGQAQRNYIKRVAVFTSLYLASFAALMLLDDADRLPYALQLALGALPGLAVIGFFWSIGRLIVEETDEFLRMLTVRQSLIASALAMSAASVWGMLESADLVPHVDAYWYAVIWFAGLALGALINRIEHGTWGAA